MTYKEEFELYLIKDGGTYEDDKDYVEAEYESWFEYLIQSI